MRKSSGFSGHSLRRGAAISAAAAGIPREDIKTLGRWKSDAVPLTYTSKHNPREFFNTRNPYISSHSYLPLRSLASSLMPLPANSPTDPDSLSAMIWAVKRAQGPTAAVLRDCNMQIRYILNTDCSTSPSSSPSDVGHSKRAIRTDQLNRKGIRWICKDQLNRVRYLRAILVWYPPSTGSTLFSRSNPCAGTLTQTGQIDVCTGMPPRTDPV
jgi:hypothetical protein